MRLCLDTNILVDFVDVHAVTRKAKLRAYDAATAVERLRAAFPAEAAGPKILDIALPAVLRHGLPSGTPCSGRPFSRPAVRCC